MSIAHGEKYVFKGGGSEDRLWGRRNLGVRPPLSPASQSRSGQKEWKETLHSLPVASSGRTEYANPFRPKSKQRIFDSAVALFTEKVFYSESLLVSAYNKISPLVEIPSQPGQGV